MTDEHKLTDKVHKGLIYGLPVQVVEDEQGEFWMAPGNKITQFILSPYIMALVHHENVPLVLYEGSYLDGLIAWYSKRNNKEE